ncbi:MAG TPA: protein kinase [Polyangiaceae bacterium]
MPERGGKRELGKNTLDAIASARTVPSVPAPESTGPHDPLLASADTMLAEGSAPSMPRMPQEGGEVLGNRYEILGELGRGGEGVVYRARDLKADAIVALKLLQEDEGSKTRLQRFRRELQMARKVTHPNVVRIHDLVELPGRFGLSMELIEGETLVDRLERGRLSREEVVRLGIDLARALAAAHQAGVTHRDLKPGNVLLRAQDGHAVVTDFGVSRAHGSQEITPAQMRTATPLALTREGILVGTPQYMALEQLEARTDIGPPADVYAFGLVVYEAATGSRLHGAETYAELLKMRREQPAPRLRERRPDLPRVLCDAVDKALARAPQDRFPSGVELLAALEPLASSSKARFAPAWIAVGAVVLASGGVFAWEHRATPSPHAPPAAQGPTTRPLVLRVSNPRRVSFGESCEEFPSFTPDGKSLVYDGTVGKDSYIFRLDLPNGTPAPLTKVNGWDMAASISPAGDRIAFLRFEGEHVGAWVAPLDGHEPPHFVTAGSVRPSWSLDGRGVWAGHGYPLAKYDADTGEVLATVKAAQSSSAPHALELRDGSLVVLYSAGVEEHLSGIFFEAAQGPSRWLTRDDLDEAFAITPDARHAVALRAMNTGTHELIDVPLDGSPSTSLSASGIPARKGVAFSPDGKQVAWSTCTDLFDIPLVDARGHLSEAASQDTHIHSIAAVPGTRTIAVVSDRSGKAEPWIEDPTGHAAARPVSIGGLSAHEIAVSPDARTFVVSVMDKGLFAGNLDGGDGGLRQLTSDPLDSRPSFRFGGKQVLFTRHLPSGQTQVFGVPVTGGDAVPVLEAPSDQASASLVDDRLVYLSGRALTDALPMTWDARTGTPRVLSSKLERGRYGEPTFSPDARRVAVTRGDTDVYEIDVASGAIIRQVKNPAGDQLSEPIYTSAGLLVERVRWRGNIWIADAQLQE